MKTLRKLNKDEITLLKLLTDAYLFANLSDVADSKWDREEKSTLNYVTVNHVNGLDANLCSTVCNPIEKAIVNIIGRDLYEEWTSFSTLVVDDLIRLIDEKMEKEMKKITRATIKSFIKKNFDDLYISTRSRFNGMIDCVDRCHDQSFYKVEREERERFADYSLGIKDAYFVGNSRDYFSPYEKDGFKGYEILNCVGSFILAINENGEINGKN